MNSQIVPRISYPMSEPQIQSCRRTTHPINHKTSTQCWSNVGPPSTTLAQYWVDVSCLLGCFCSSGQRPANDSTNIPMSMLPLAGIRRSIIGRLEYRICDSGILGTSWEAVGNNIVAGENQIRSLICRYLCHRTFLLVSIRSVKNAKITRDVGFILGQGCVNVSFFLGYCCLQSAAVHEKSVPRSYWGKYSLLA